MFTGIVEELGTVTACETMGGGLRFHIRAPHAAAELRVNDSVSVNGACHTVVWRDDASFKVESVEETLKKTALGTLKKGSAVNLELPMKLNERLGGHLVLGHVDTVGTVTEITARESSWMTTVEVPERFSRYLVPTGSVSVDGVSLTIAELAGNRFTVSIIPHTMDHTIWKQYAAGSPVNIEFDLVGKYIEQMIPTSATSPKPDLEESALREQGF
jgi:riboflavin synthase